VKIIQKHVQGVSILTLDGKIDLGNGVAALRGAIVAAQDAKEHQIVLDCTAVSGMDSSAVGELFRIDTTVANMGGRVTICGLSPKMQELFKITRLHELFTYYDNEDDAIASYQP
jgi:anti-anti-sigma factor